MFTIGLTGGIGSGKSAVAQEFENLGVPVFDTDSLARQVVAPGQPAFNEIVKSFGMQVQTKDGTLDRQLLRQIVFNDVTARDQLEAIVHPRIRQALQQQINSCDAAYCVAVIPLLVEKNWQALVDRIVVVDVPEHIQLERASQRDHLSTDTIRQIMANQASRQSRLSHADDVIDNTGSLDALKDQVTRLHHQYLAFSNKH